LTASTIGERTTEAILDAAERLILDQGYHGTSMQQIAREAGIAVGGIYNHFDSKEAIFGALLDRHQPYADIAAGLSTLSDASVAELIEAAARLFIERGLADPVFIRLAFIDLQEFGGDTVFRLAAQMIQALMALIGPLVTAGELRNDIPLPVLVRSFAGLFVFFLLSDGPTDWALPRRF
jgi:AcrR family transcriptional regulator